MARATERQWWVGLVAVAALVVAAHPMTVQAQKPEVEETTPAKPGKPGKPTPPPKPESEDTKPPVTTEPPAGADDLGAKVNLAEAAKNANYPEVTLLFERLKEPTDEIEHIQKGIIRSKPVPICLVNRPNDKPLKFEPLDRAAAGGLGGIHEATTGTIRRITPYELIVVRETDAFLKQPLKNTGDRPNPRIDQLAAAETALTAALQFHQAARASNGRTGDGWDPVQQQVRDQLLRFQVERLKELASANMWADASALLTKLHRANPDNPVAQPDMIRVRVQRFLKLDGKGIADDDVGAIRATLEKLRSRHPTNMGAPPALLLFRQELPSQAVKLRDLGMQRFAQNRTPEGVALLRLASALYPELPGLEDELRRRTNDYPILYVGVPRLPELMSPATARTDSERQAVELLFESLVQAVPDVRTALVKETAGLRWRSVLADDLPRLLTRGREFRIVRGATWAGDQPGEPVTANDVAGTLRLYRDLKGGRVPADLEFLKEPVVDEQFRLRMYFNAGFVDPLELLNFKVLPADKRLAGRRADDEGFARRPVGSGPYQLVLNRGADGQEHAVVTENGREQVIFRANPAYSSRPEMGGPPARPIIREIRFVKSNDPAAEFKTGQLHLLLGASVDDVSRLQEASAGLGNTIQVVTPPSRRIWILAINHRKPLLQSQELRRLLCHAIDRKKVLDVHFREGKDDAHKELTGPFPPDCWATPKDSRPLFNPQLAASLAQQRAAQQPQIHLRLSCPDDTRIQEMCRKSLKPMIEGVAPGVTIDIQPVPLDELLQQVKQPSDYELAYIPYDYRSDLFWPGDLLQPQAYGGVDILGYQPDPDLEALLRDVRAHTNFIAVRKRMHDLHTALVGPQGRMPFVPLWQLDTPVVLSSKLQLPFPPDRLDPLTVFTLVEEWKLSR